MASLHYDERRGLYRVWYHDGLSRKSETVARLPPGTRKPKVPPPEAVRRYEELRASERASRSDRPNGGAPLTLAAFAADEVSRFERAGKRPASVAFLRRAMDALLQTAQARKITALAAFGPDDARAHLERLARRGVGGNTLGTECRYLSAAWNRAIRRKLVGSNPWANLCGADELPVGRREPSRPSWTAGEFATLTSACRPWLRRVLVFGTRLGLRASELVALDGSWVEWDGDEPRAVVVPAAVAKSGKSRRVPLHADLVPLVRTSGREGPLCPNQAGRRISHRNVLDTCLRRACARAGLPRVGTHAVRRSFGRWAVLGRGPWQGRPVPMYVVSRWLGHSSLSQTAVYLALDESSSDAYMSGE